MSTVAQKKRASTSGIIMEDQRGTNPPSQKIAEEKLEQARQHLLSIPSYESHYTRRDSERKYFPSYLTISQLYEEYTKQYPHEPVSRRIYESLFHDMKLSIKKPKTDTCQTCDKLTLQLNASEDKTDIKRQLDEHHYLADQAYRAKSQDKNSSKDDPEKKTIAFDLQQCLPTPMVQNSLAFYKRPLWTCNLTVHDCDKNQAH